jgi:steroid 5-alpha reductase family enzyme
MIGFLVAYLRQTDHFTDVIYALSFMLIAGYGLYLNPNPQVFHWVLFIMISMWSIRLAIFLGYRIRIWGHDKRFDGFRKAWLRLLRFWVLQYLSILIIALPLFIVLIKTNVELVFWQGFGLIVFISGLLIESIADYQKFVFKLDDKNKKSFIQSGLWKYSRHPNYLGEWFVWLGIFLYCMPLLQGFEWIALASPLWIFILLRFISGGNLLENSAKVKYRNNPNYQSYIENTGIFFPKIFT